MKNKIIGLNTLVLALFILFGVNAHAAYESIYTVDANGSTTAKNTFGLDEQPWLYLKLSQAVTNFTSSWWNDPETSAYFAPASLTPSNTDEYWITLSNWDSVKKAGLWQVFADTFYFNGTNDLGSTRFTVTPEPVSSSLFVLGGAALAISRIRRKNKK